MKAKEIARLAWANASNDTTIVTLLERVILQERQRLSDLLTGEKCERKCTHEDCKILNKMSLLLLKDK